MREKRKIEGQKRRVTRKDRKRLGEEPEVGGKKGLWNVVNGRMLEDRGVLLREDGDLLREYHAMHEESFLSSCGRMWTVKKKRGRR